MNDESCRPGGALALFVYGTLMRGRDAHATQGLDGLRIEAAKVAGWLFALPAGYPALRVCPGSILATGSHEPASDAALQRRLGELRQDLETQPEPTPAVHGEVITLEDPGGLLPELDRYEGFSPASGASLYRRVLVPARLAAGSSRLVWTYVMESPESRSGEFIPGGDWARRAAGC